MKMPDIKRHYIISMVKSILRIAGYLVALLNFTAGMVILVVAEVLGVVEENV